MKFIKKIALPALLCCGIVVSIVSCKDENIEKSDAVVKSKDLSASRKLATLENKINPSDKDFNEYSALYNSLSFDELIEFRRLQQQKIKVEMGDKVGLNESLERDMQWFTKINKLSIELFGKPMNQLSDLQKDEVFLADGAKNSKQAKIAACSPVTFTTTFTRGIGGTTNLGITSVQEVSQPGSLNDCDCQIAYPTSNTNFRRLFPTSLGARNLLSSFGNNISGRQFSAGSFPVIGRTRANFFIPTVPFVGCSGLIGQLTLSNR